MKNLSKLVVTVFLVSQLMLPSSSHAIIGAILSSVNMVVFGGFSGGGGYKHRERNPNDENLGGFLIIIGFILLDSSAQQSLAFKSINMDEAAQLKITDSDAVATYNSEIEELNRSLIAVTQKVTLAQKLVKPMTPDESAEVWKPYIEQLSPKTIDVARQISNHMMGAL